MAWRPYLEGHTVPDPKADAKDGVRIEQYKISREAVYFPKEQYLLISDIKRTWIQSSRLSVAGSCGRGIPVFVVRLDHGDEKKVNLMVEKQENAEKMVRLLTEINPSIKVEEWSREAQLNGTAPR